MATELKLRRGSTTQNNGFTGASGEITVDTDKKTVVVQDGSTAGGTPLATEANLTTLDNAAVKTTGNQSIAGTKTFSDNTDFSAGIDVTGTVTTDSLTLGDNDKLKLGVGGDLEIYHTGGNSFIDDVGAGVLKLRASNRILLQGYDTGDTYASFNENGQSQLFHNNTMHLNTYASGVNVNGTLTTTNGIDITGSSTIDVGTGYLNVKGSDDHSGLKLSNTNTSTAGQSDILFQRTENPVVNGTPTGIGQIIFEADNSSASPFSFANITAYADQFTAGQEESYVSFFVRDGSGNSERLQVNKNGIDVNGAVKADSIELDQRQDPPATATNGDMYFDSDNQSLYVRRTPAGGTAEWSRVTTESSEFIQFKQTQTLSVTPQVGMIYFDSDDQKLKVYTSTNGGQFENLN